MMKRLLILPIVLFAAAAYADDASTANPTAKSPSEEKPQVEVVFVLDSTGSMGGLIEGAKQKIWGIANEIISQKPTPEVRMGLLTYRDKGDEYVTKMFDITDDIETIFGHLTTITAGGGSDSPESVNSALTKRSIKWSGSRKNRR